MFYCGKVDLIIACSCTLEQYDIWIENSKDGYWMPKIIPCKELEGMEYNKIYCHALGVKNIKEYIDKPILSFAEAKEMFPDGLNWVHIKLG
jgi:hypothetical protein